MSENFDYIVVGAGSSGCALANRLAATKPDSSVLLIEAGSRDWQPMVHIPLGFAFLLGGGSWNWGYESQAVTGLGGRQLNLPRGKMLGGTSSLNGMVYIRGQREDFDGWAEAGNSGWSFDEVLPFFKQFEDNYRSDDPYHGQGGALSISEVSEPLAITEAFIESACQFGLPRNDDFNGAEQRGAGFFDGTIRNGRRWSAARAFLNRASRPSNLTVRTSLEVLNLLWRGNRATSVCCRRGAKQLQFDAGSEIVLCAGVFNSPKLLELSGVGDAQRLTELGIPVVSDLPGVGENLQDHLNMYVESDVRAEETYFDYVNSWRILPTAARWVFTRRGILANPAAVAGAFFALDPASTRPDVQVHFAAAASRPDKNGWMQPIPGTTAAVCLIQPSSRGNCHIASSDPGAAPLIQPNFLDTQDDRERSLKALRTLREILAKAPFADFVASEIRPGSDRQSDDELLEYIRENAESVHHAAGTCKMGSDDQAVVDQELRVHGTEGLRLADASIMPTVTSGNTHATCIMIAEKAASMM
jgi:choline dehydrogenase